jgi:hypothetical protein
MRSGLNRLTWHRQAQRRAPCYLRVPRTSILLRALLGSCLLLVLLQAVSCGMFFCVELPFSRRLHIDYGELVTDAVLLVSTPAVAAAAAAAGPGSGVAAAAGAAAASSQAAAAGGQAGLPSPLIFPKLIPRVMHQTYRSSRLPSAARALMRSWQEQNGDTWQVGRRPDSR